MYKSATQREFNLYSTARFIKILSAQFSMFNSQCSILNVQFSMFNSQCSILNSQCSIFNLQSSMFNSQCSILNVQCSMFKFFMLLLLREERLYALTDSGLYCFAIACRSSSSTSFFLSATSKNLSYKTSISLLV